MQVVAMRWQEIREMLFPEDAGIETLHQSPAESGVSSLQEVGQIVAERAPRSVPMVAVWQEDRAGRYRLGLYAPILLPFTWSKFVIASSTVGKAPHVQGLAHLAPAYGVHLRVPRRYLEQALGKG